MSLIFFLVIFLFCMDWSHFLHTDIVFLLRFLSIRSMQFYGSLSVVFAFIPLIWYVSRRFLFPHIMPHVSILHFVWKLILSSAPKSMVLGLLNLNFMVLSNYLFSSFQFISVFHFIWFLIWYFMTILQYVEQVDFGLLVDRYWNPW